MKILYLAHRFPYPPDKGDKIRSYHQWRGLNEAGHEVHLACLVDDPVDWRRRFELKRAVASAFMARLSRPRAMLRALLAAVAGRSFSVAYFHSTELRREVERLLRAQAFDAILVYSSSMARYIPPEHRGRAVVDLVDVDSEKWREYARRSGPIKAWLYDREATRLRTVEESLVDEFAHSLVTTAREADCLSRGRASRLHVLPNGVDAEYFHPPEQRRSNDPPLLVFTGAMDYEPNIDGVCWFVESILPLIRRRLPAIELYIVGHRPVGRVRRLEEHPGVKVTGSVEDVRPYLHRALASVAPLRIARGIQNKVLEAMAMEKAVVATPEAVAGLAVVPGEQLLMAGDPESFAQAVIALGEDPGLRARLGGTARRYVLEHHDWRDHHRRLIGILESVSGAPARCRVSVLICTRNRAASLESTLARFFAQNFDDTYAYELIVVDNGSTDETAEVIARYRSLHPEIVQPACERRVGLSHARNAALSRARGEILVFTDDDVLVAADWLNEICREFREHPEVGLLGGRVLRAREDLQAVTLQTSETRQVFAYPDGGTFVIGANMAMRREVFERVGWFDPRLGAGRFFAGAEEADLLYRALKAGFTVLYAPNVLVYHDHNRFLVEQACRLEFGYGKGCSAYLIKHALAGDRYAMRMVYWLLHGLPRRWRRREGEGPDLTRRRRAQIRGILVGMAAAPWVMWGRRRTP